MVINIKVFKPFWNS